MNNSVTVTANDQNQVVVPSSTNEEFGYVRVEQGANVFDNGWMRKQTRSAIIRGKVADLQSMGLKKGQQLPGKIQIIESTTPTNVNNLDQDVKKNPQTGQTLTHLGAPIYRTAVYTQDMDVQDVLVQHDVVAVASAKPAVPVGAGIEDEGGF
jgi:hypothetical protein